MTAITAWKGIHRSNLLKHYSNMVYQCERVHNKTEVKLRVMRAYKVTLFNEYCNSVLEEAYASSLRYNIIS